MYSIETPIRINYRMTDQMGYVYFGNYPEFYDIGRTELLRTLELEPSRLEKKGIMMPVRKLELKYCKPAFYDELIIIKTTLKEYSPLKLVFQFEIFNAEEKAINLGCLELAFVYKDSRKPRRSNDIVKQIEAKIYHEA